MTVPFGPPSPDAPDPPVAATRVAPEDRLRAAELRIERLGAEVGPAPRERLATLEARIQALASQTDLEKAKRWVVVGLASAGFSVLALLVRIVTWLFPN